MQLDALIERWCEQSAKWAATAVAHEDHGNRTMGASAFAMAAVYTTCAAQLTDALMSGEGGYVQGMTNEAYDQDGGR